MITADALCGVPLFSALPPAALDYVAWAVEDIRLLAGEYFAQEGDERALFVVIEGRAEITKVVNGDELVIGVRTPGMLFGEVPMTLSTKFPASGRASEPTRILRLGVSDHHSLAALASSVAAHVGGVARGYLTDLQNWGAATPEAEAHLIGPRADRRVREIATFRSRSEIPFERVAPDAAATDGPVLDCATGAASSIPPCGRSPSAWASASNRRPRSTTSSSSGQDPPGSRRRSTAPPRAWAPSSSRAWRRAVRPARRRASRKLHRLPVRGVR